MDQVTVNNPFPFLKLTTREKAVLIFIESRKMVFASDIVKRFFPGQAKPNHYRLLGNLRRKELTKVEILPSDNKLCGYKLTEKGVDLVRQFELLPTHLETRIINKKNKPAESRWTYLIKTSKREYEILFFLFANGFATANIIKENFFVNQSGKNHYRNILKLQSSGLISVLRGPGNSRLGYRLTKKGIAYIKLKSSLPIERTHRSPSFIGSFDHDATLIRLRQIFESSPFVSNYRNEKQLRTEFAKLVRYRGENKCDFKVSDSQFDFRTPTSNFRVAIELEISQKSSPRYYEMVKRLALSPNIDAVFFVVSNDEIPKTLKRIYDDLQNKDAIFKSTPLKNGFYFVHLDALLFQRLDAVLQGFKTSFSLNQLNNEMPSVSVASKS
jgi:DNA-binding PadR family transcriptional regulator